MRRLILLVTAAALSVVAFALPEPPAPEGPTFEGPSEVSDDATAQSSVWYCPWLNAGAQRDSWLMLASDANADIEVTLPSPIPNEEADRAEFSIEAPGSDPLEVGSIVRRGDAPGFVEFSDGPSGVAGVVTSDTVVTGDRCVSSVPKLWHVTGATTREARTSVLRLFNPFPEPAKVTVAGTSEFGDVGLVGLTSIDVPGRLWTDIVLNEIVPLLDDLALTISTEEGLVIPQLVVGTVTDEATWPGTALSTTWEFPVVRQTGLQPSLVVSNPGDVEVEIEIDALGVNESSLAARTEVVPPRSPLRIPLGDLVSGPFGVAVRSTGPIAAVVISEDPTRRPDEEQDIEGEEEEDETEVTSRIAGTVGAPQPVQRWLLPGPGAVRAAVSSVWLMNSHSEAVTVSLQPLGVGELEVEEVLVEAGTTVRIVLPQETGVSGYLVEAPTPISAAWAVESGDGVAFVAGISLDG